MECPVCHNTFTNPWEKFSIEKQKRCVDCQKKWSDRPENNPENKKFRFSYTIRDDATIYAKTEEEAVEKFENNYEYDEYEVQEIKL